MHSEEELRRACRILLEKYISLKTSELTKLITEVLAFDADDLVPNPTRQKSKRYPNREPYVYQRIRNIATKGRVPSGTIRYYPEGFAVDKRKGEPIWLLSSGFCGNERVSKSEQNTNVVDKKHVNSKGGKKIDWDIINEHRTDLGARGEEFVLNYEKDRIANISRESVERVIHASIVEGDGLGYDILSLNRHGETIYIEVKTTAGDCNTPFYMSDNEKKFIETHKNAYIYRVYHFDTRTRHGEIEVIKSSKFLKNYYFDPVSFRVTKK